MVVGESDIRFPGGKYYITFTDDTQALQRSGPLQATDLTKSGVRSGG